MRDAEEKIRLERSCLFMSMETLMTRLNLEIFFFFLSCQERYLGFKYWNNYCEYSIVGSCDIRKMQNKYVWDLGSLFEGGGDI